MENGKPGNLLHELHKDFTAAVNVIRMSENIFTETVSQLLFEKSSRYKTRTQEETLKAWLRIQKDALHKGRKYYECVKMGNIAHNCSTKIVWLIVKEGDTLQVIAGTLRKAVSLEKSKVALRKTSKRRRLTKILQQCRIRPLYLPRNVIIDMNGSTIQRQETIYIVLEILLKTFTLS